MTEVVFNCPKCDGSRMSVGYCHYCERTGRVIDRDSGGRLVREAWIDWAKSKQDYKASWVVPYDQLNEMDKEADRLIFERIINKLAETCFLDFPPIANKCIEL